MKLQDYKLTDWDNEEIEQEIKWNDIKIILLKLKFIDNPPVEGSRNLLAIDKEGNIVWIAKIPKMHGIYGSYGQIELSSNILLAWCGSIYCEIDPQTGKILKEQFVK
jgi:hypothetical protein